MKRDDGFTLVELLTVIAVSGILLTAIFSVLISGYENFKFGSNKAEIQSDIRLVENILQDELRNAVLLKIASSKPSPVSNNSNPIKNIDIKKGEDNLYYLNHNGRKITGNIFNDISISIDNSLLNIKLFFDKRDNYQIKIVLNNLDIGDIDVSNSPSLKSTDKTLYYQLPNKER